LARAHSATNLRDLKQIDWVSAHAFDALPASSADAFEAPAEGVGVLIS